MRTCNQSNCQVGRLSCSSPWCGAEYDWFSQCPTNN